MKENHYEVSKVFKIFNAIKDDIAPNEHLNVLAALKKVKILESCNAKEMSNEKLYELMTKVAADFDLSNPFTNKNQFINIYRALEGLDTLHWADILGYGNGKSKFIVPMSIVDQMKNNFTKGNGEVLIGEAEKFAPFLETLIKTYHDYRFTLTTMSGLYYKILSEMFANNEMVDIKLTSIYQYEFTPEKFDLILSVPEFGIREKATVGSQFICREYDMIALENLSLHLKSEGILSIVLPAKITYAGGSVKELREFIQSMYSLKEVSELPPGIFYNTGIKTFLLTITTGRTDEVTFKKFYFTDEKIHRTGYKKLIVKEDTFVLEDELSDMGDWNIDRILESQDEDWIKFQESNIKKQELGTVASIFRGKAVNRKDPNGRIGVVNISNIGEYEIDYSLLDHLEEDDRKVASYVLQTGDLLIPARGTAIRIAIFEEQPYPCIASSNVIVIRAKDKSLSPTYLKLFFDSPLGRKILVNRQQGTSVMNISYKELNNIDIPLPSIEEQLSIAKEYTDELKIYKKAVQDAENRWDATLSRLQSRL